MTKKPSIATLVGGYTSASRLNTIFQQILDAFDNTVSRDGSTPNTMSADLDMNNNDLLNVKEVRASKLYAGGTQVTDATYVPNWNGEWATSTAYVVNDTVRNDGNVYICLVAHTSGTFSADLSANKWELFASKGSAGAGSGDMLAANNLSDLVDTAASRTNLGVSIGNDVQAYSPKTSAVAALDWVANKILLFTGTSTVSTLDFKDEDNMASNSATAVPSQQSTKAYVDSRTTRFESTTGQSPVLSTTLTFAHGLSSEPDFVQLVLECTTSEGGYTVGDRIFFGNAWGYSNVGQTVWADNTNVYVRVGSSALATIEKTSGISFILTPANWRVHVKAFVFN